MTEPLRCACGHVMTGPVVGETFCAGCGRPISAAAGAGEAPVGGRGLGIAALVFSLILCVPIFPLVGMGLGIAALVRSTGRPGAPGRTLAIVAIVVAGLGVVPSFGVMAAVAIPGFLHYIREAKMAEADENLARISHSVEGYYAESGRLPEPAPLTPSEPCSSRPDGRCEAGVGWDHPSWRALGFSISDPTYFQYELETDETSFVARALADLDQDGVMSTFERHGRLEQGGLLSVEPEPRRYHAGE